MKILCIVDAKTWAIGKLTQSIIDHNPAHDFKLLAVHPKHVAEHLGEVRAALEWKPDVIHFCYWNTARQLLEALPELRNYRTVLTHHNQKDLLSTDWRGIKAHAVHTKYSYDKLTEAGYDDVRIIQHGLNLDYFTYAEKPSSTPAVGYCGRIVPWKGLKNLAEICFEEKIPLIAMGKMDKPDYWASIDEGARAWIDFSFMDVPDALRIEFYRNITLFVGNSDDGREEGTLPLLEAMACGVPVATTPTGEAADIITDGVNGIILPFGDKEALRKAIKDNFVPNEFTESLRSRAWVTVKTMNEKKMAREYSKLYNDVAHNLPLVSVIIPAYNASESVLKILDNLAAAKWANIEVVIADDGSTDYLFGSISDWRENHRGFTVKYIHSELSGDKDYGLARARNAAVIEAEGEYLLFCDSRMLPDITSINVFVNKLVSIDREKTWLFGEKGGGKDSFVENFSFIKRDMFIKAGMCNERIDRYGGMSQELRERFLSQGFKFVYVPEARATQMKSSRMSPERRKDIIDMKFKLYKMGL